MKTETTFKNLNTGDTFDFISGSLDSFFKRCEKISTRKYKDEDGAVHKIGSTGAKVYHVQRNSR